MSCSAVMHKVTHLGCQSPENDPSDSPMPCSPLNPRFASKGPNRFGCNPSARRPSWTHEPSAWPTPAGTRTSVRESHEFGTLGHTHTHTHTPLSDNTTQVKNSLPRDFPRPHVGIGPGRTSDWRLCFVMGDRGVLSGQLGPNAHQKSMTMPGNLKS